MKDADAEPQNSKQVWFSGVHSDIGGGYPEKESGAAKITLQWMIDEAQPSGLLFKKTMVNRLVLGKNPRNSQRVYSKPDPQADLHDSMTSSWRILEWIPKSTKLKDWPERQSILGCYIPRSEPRLIAAKANIHASVKLRKKYQQDGKSYNPENVPS